MVEITFTKARKLCCQQVASLKTQLLYRIENFAPAWFAMVMGVGISGSILLRYPFPSYWLRACGIVFYGFATALFILFFIMSFLRLILYPRSFHNVLLHPTQSLFWGCMPMGMASIINDTMSIWADKAIWPCFVLWSINLAFSIGCAWILVCYGFIHTARKQPGALNAIILLPAVSLIVNSATGSLLVSYLPVNYRPPMILIALAVWGNGEMLTYALICVYTWRLLTSNMPQREAILSCFLPIGPLGQGAYGFLVNAQNAEDYLVGREYPHLQQVFLFKYIGLAVATIMLGFATFWLFIAIAACIYYRPRNFGVSWWALSFPMGTYAMAAIEIGTSLEILVFKVIGALVGTAVVLVSLVLSIFTVYYGVIQDDMFRGLQTEMDSMFPPTKELNDEFP